MNISTVPAGTTVAQLRFPQPTALNKYGDHSKTVSATTSAFGASTLPVGISFDDALRAARELSRASVSNFKPNQLTDLVGVLDAGNGQLQLAPLRSGGKPMVFGEQWMFEYSTSKWGSTHLAVVKSTDPTVTKVDNALLAVVDASRYADLRHRRNDVQLKSFAS